jgi:DNA invertase Pin-like site-specific DNA recombinase
MEHEMKLRAIASCRVSTPEQTENGSLNRQQRSIEDAAITLGVEIVRIWSQDQSSRVGKNFKRPDLLAMYEFCQTDKRIKYLLVNEVDRFMRSIRELYYWEQMFLGIGVTVYYAGNPALNESDGGAKLTKLIDAFKAESSNDDRVRASKDGIKDKLEQGYWPSHTHQGYKKSVIAGLHIRDNYRDEMLISAKDNILSGEYTVSDAMKQLNEIGYKTPPNKNNPYGQSLRIDKFKALLCDPYYGGIIEVKKFDINRPGLHAPLWTFEEHETLKAIVAGGKRAPYERQIDNPDFPLKAILRSDDCAAKADVTGFWKVNGKNNGWRKPKYRCMGKDSNNVLCLKEYNVSTIHEQWEAILSRVDLSGDVQRRLMVSLGKVWDGNQKTSLQRIAGIESRVEGLTVEKNLLVRSSVDPENAAIKDDLREQIEDVKAQIAELQYALLDARDIEKDFLAFAEFSLRYLAELKTNWWNLDKTEMQSLSHTIFPAGVWLQQGDQKVHTPEIAAIFSFLSENNNKKELDYASNSLLVELRGIAPRSVRLLASGLQAYSTYMS